MNHTTSVSTSTQNPSGRLIAAATTCALALVMLTGVGFVQGSNGAVHNAAHDTRHIMSFPCH